MTDPGEQTTGTRDEHYNLISVLYHALHGAQTIEAYILDAEAAGDERLAEFFREAQATHRQLAERAKGLLGIGGDPPLEASGAPLETELPPDTMPEDLPPDAPTEEIPTTSNVPRNPPGGMSEGVPAGGDLPTGDVPPRTAQSGWETPPPRPRRASPADEAPTGEDAVAETGGVAPDAPVDNILDEPPEARQEDTQRRTASEPSPETRRESPPPSGC